MQLVAANAFEAEWDESCDALHADLEFLPPPEYQSPKQKEGLKNAEAVAKQDIEEEKKELDEVAKLDAVNEESKAELEKKLQGKIQQKMHDNKDAAELNAELKDVAAQDAVNEESKAELEKKLHANMIKRKQDAMDKAEIQEELKEVAEIDAVNEESKSKLAEQLKEVKTKQNTSENGLEAAAGEKQSEDIEEEVKAKEGAEPVEA